MPRPILVLFGATIPFCLGACGTPTPDYGRVELTVSSPHGNAPMIGSSWEGLSNAPVHDLANDPFPEEYLLYAFSPHTPEVIFELDLNGPLVAGQSRTLGGDDSYIGLGYESSNIGWSSRDPGGSGSIQVDSTDPIRLSFNNVVLASQDGSLTFSGTGEWWFEPR